MYTDRDPIDLPWDVARVIANRKFRQAVEQRIQMEREFPAPTPRTKHNASGFQLWTEYLEMEQRLRFDEGYEKPCERYPLHVPGAYLAFDHKIWFKWGELCYFHKGTVKAYRVHEIPEISTAGVVTPVPKEQKQAEVLEVFG